jgi:hypothetical protein
LCWVALRVALVCIFLDAGYWILDAGNWELKTANWELEPEIPVSPGMTFWELCITERFSGETDKIPIAAWHIPLRSSCSRV